MSFELSWYLEQFPTILQHVLETVSVEKKDVYVSMYEKIMLIIKKKQKKTNFRKYGHRIFIIFNRIQTC